MLAWAPKRESFRLRGDCEAVRMTEAEDLVRGGRRAHDGRALGSAVQSADPDTRRRLSHLVCALRTNTVIVRPAEYYPYRSTDHVV